MFGSATERVDRKVYNVPSGSRGGVLTVLRGPPQKSRWAAFHVRGRITHLLRPFSLSLTLLAPQFLYLAVHLVQRAPQHVF